MGDERKRNNSNKWTVQYDGIKTDGVYTIFQKFLVSKFLIALKKGLCSSRLHLIDRKKTVEYVEILYLKKKKKSIWIYF